MSSLYVLRIVVLQMASAILYVTKSLRKSDENNLLPFLASILRNRANDILDVAERLIEELSREEAKSCLLDLLSSIRLVVSSLSEVCALFFIAIWTWI